MILRTEVYLFQVSLNAEVWKSRVTGVDEAGLEQLAELCFDMMASQSTGNESAIYVEIFFFPFGTIGLI